MVDVFGTDTADYADVVLPAASFLEFDDLVVSYFHCSVSAQVKAADPPGDVLPNGDAFADSGDSSAIHSSRVTIRLAQPAG